MKSASSKKNQTSICYLLQGVFMAFDGFNGGNVVAYNVPVCISYGEH